MPPSREQNANFGGMEGQKYATITSIDKLLTHTELSGEDRQKLIDLRTRVLALDAQGYSEHRVEIQNTLKEIVGKLGSLHEMSALAQGPANMENLNKLIERTK